jgi:hypothetical protein
MPCTAIGAAATIVVRPALVPLGPRTLDQPHHHLHPGGDDLLAVRVDGGLPEEELGGRERDEGAEREGGADLRASGAPEQGGELVEGAPHDLLDGAGQQVRALAGLGDEDAEQLLLLLELEEHVARHQGELGAPAPQRRRSGRGRDDGTVTFLDFGSVKRLSPAAQRGFWGIPTAAIAGYAEALSRVLMDQGFIRADDPAPPEKMLAWCRPNFAALYEPQPVRFTPEFAASTLGHLVSMDKDVMRRIAVPRDFVFPNRIYVGLYSILGALRATADWRGIFEEDTTGQPTTELGHLEAEFFGARSRP